MNLVQRKIRVAIQKKGRLRQLGLDFLTSVGLRFALPENGELIVPCDNAEVELLLVRNSDIPVYVQNGIADFGIVGENVLYEQNRSELSFKKLGFGKCCLVVAAPENSAIKRVEDLYGERVATSYPNSVRKFFAERNIPASIIVINGSVEIAPGLGLADAICDIVQTGNTLRSYGLSQIDKVLDSEAVLIVSPIKHYRQSEFIQRFLS